jgi:hypothetical protein
MNDRQKIISYLKANKTITCLEAIHNIGVYNLRSRASEIPELVSELIPVTKSNGQTVRVAQYHLINH